MLAAARKDAGTRRATMQTMPDEDAGRPVWVEWPGDNRVARYVRYAGVIVAMVTFNVYEPGLGWLLTADTEIGPGEKTAWCWTCDHMGSGQEQSLEAAKAAVEAMVVKATGKEFARP
jgi:hypothetical protein